MAITTSKLFVGIYPVGLWTDPADVECLTCGYWVRLPTCAQAQRAAWDHEAAHMDGVVPPAKQLSLFVSDESPHS